MWICEDPEAEAKGRAEELQAVYDKGRESGMDEERKNRDEACAIAYDRGVEDTERRVLQGIRNDFVRESDGLYAHARADWNKAIGIIDTKIEELKKATSSR